MDNNNQVDWDFIFAKEGGVKTTAYVPVCTPKSVTNPANRTCFGKPTGSVIGKSGITIGSGIDLGQMSLDDLRKLKLPQHLFNTFSLFVGKKKADALKALEDYQKKNNRNLQITSTDARIINQRVKQKTLHQLIHNYNKHSATSFDKLAPAAQTALTSFAFQYGPNMHASKNAYVQKVWKNYVDKDYSAVVDTLNNAHEYHSRRKEEAEMVSKVNNANQFTRP